MWSCLLCMDIFLFFTVVSVKRNGGSSLLTFLQNAMIGMIMTYIMVIESSIMMDGRRRNSG